MKNILSIILITISLNSIAFSDGGYDIEIKKQCQYTIYGNGENNPFVANYILGMVVGQYFTMRFDKITLSEVGLAASSNRVVELACKEALANNSSIGFEGAYNLGIKYTIRKDSTRFSNLK